MAKVCKKFVFHIAKPICESDLVQLITLIVLLCSFFYQTNTSFAAPSSIKATSIPLVYCSNPSPHCYAEQYWSVSTPGIYTQIEPYGALNCSFCTGGFIDNEMWFSDNISSQCTNTAFGGCWIESGISTWPANTPNNCNQGVSSTCLFWADNRPGSGGYHEHALYNFGSDGVDLTPYYVNLTLYNANGPSVSGSSWQVTANVFNSSNTLIAQTGGTSTVNNMTPTFMTIGSELSDGNAFAGPNYFSFNEWSSAGKWSFNYQTNPGYNGSTNAPPYGAWTVTPCNCSGNIGGTYKTIDN